MAKLKRTGKARSRRTRKVPRGQRTIDTIFSTSQKKTRLTSPFFQGSYRTELQGQFTLVMGNVNANEGGIAYGYSFAVQNPERLNLSAWSAMRVLYQHYRILGFSFRLQADATDSFGLVINAYLAQEFVPAQINKQSPGPGLLFTKELGAKGSNTSHLDHRVRVSESLLRQAVLSGATAPQVIQTDQQEVRPGVLVIVVTRPAPAVPLAGMILTASFSFDIEFLSPQYSPPQNQLIELQAIQ